jgi:aminoglycoside phosphotransferase (APT) family kinase protein
MSTHARTLGASDVSAEGIRVLEKSLSAYLSDRWKDDVRVTKMTLVPGGAARATWRCLAASSDAERGLIVRFDSGKQLLPTDERAEYLVMCAVHKAGLPVPEPLFFEQDFRWLGQAFSIMSEVPDSKTSPDQIPPEHRSKLGCQFWKVLGEMTAISPQEFGVDRFLAGTTPERCAKEQLLYWWRVLQSTEIHCNPISHAAFRWLNRTPPPPPRKLVLVHGDYRTGNYLYTSEGEILAILDWEMAHVGDPLEDLAWSLDLRQNIDKPEFAGGLLPHRDAIKIWQAASGLHIDPDAFRWWQVFSAFKALAIWTLSAQKFHVDSEKRPVLARIGWLLVDRQQRILLDYISPFSKRRGFEYVL